jgi:hypothetical protein
VEVGTAHILFLLHSVQLQGQWPHWATHPAPSLALTCSHPR